jgi:Protein of unknown function (DUF1592)/Protein of unknown function (DUF1588)/Protein of unknown function (DUF1587)/Protein of unknown function (DUF1595)/Protein of unknown function (DUF1585)
MRAHRFAKEAALAASLAVTVAFAASVGACSGDLGGPDDGSGNGPGGSSGSTNPAAACTTISPGAAPLRRLTQSQYNNVVRDLLGDATRPADGFPPDQTTGTFSNNAASQTVSPLLAQSYQQAAESLAATAITNKSAILPCDPAKAGEDACAKQFIQTFAKRAYRRPLAQAEVDALVALYTTNRQGATFDNGVQAVLEAVLNSATFLYMPELGLVDQAKPGNVVPLAPYEMASRLSFFLWNSMPDDALFAAADAGQLATPEQVSAQARRMIADPKAHDATREFFDQWMNLKALAAASKDSATYPAYTTDVKTSMLAETRAFLDYVMWQADGHVDTLLTAPVSFLDANTAKIYGVPAPNGSGLVKTSLDPSQRGGILTQPAVLTALAKPNQSSPILRGKFVRERLLCQQLPPPPANLVIVPPEVKPGATTRQRFAEHDKNPACAGCHSLMDPIGFGFEHFDGIGMWRTTDQNLPVDATGTLSSSDVDGPFDGVTDLAKKLATSSAVKDCVATEFYRYTLGRAETDADKCSLDAVKATFASKTYDMKELLVAITVTDAFRYRQEVKP